MKTYRECLSCFERQAADACAASHLDEPSVHVVLTAVRAKIRGFLCDQPPIKMAMEIHELVRSQSGITDPYAAAKKAANRVCRECVPRLADVMAWTPTPLKTAVQLSIAGNIIDCGAYGLRDVSKSELCGVMQEVLAQPLRGDPITRLRSLMNNAKQILYIGDNAGECFFDVPLLRLVPSDSLMYAVRGGPILNDATAEDARSAGIHEICPVIDTGDTAPGILLERCSKEFKDAFEASDLIISKGQGNYESLSGVKGRTIAFLTKVKCEVIARDIGYPLGSNVMKVFGSTESES